MKIAVTTSDGFHVDEGFGMCGSFYIFKVDREGVNFLETRNMRIKDEHPEALNAIYNLIKDCKALYTAQIEKFPNDWFVQMGITPVEYQGEINNLAYN